MGDYGNNACLGDAKQPRANQAEMPMLQQFLSDPKHRSLQDVEGI